MLSNSTIKIACCDDDLYLLQQLCDHINFWSVKTGNTTCVRNFIDFDEIISSYKIGYRADLVFLDINFEGKSVDGLWAAKQLKDIDDAALIVFLTALSKYILEGYGIAEKYILKPFDQNVISNVLDQVYKKLARPRALKIKSRDTVINIPISDIFFIESIGHSIVIHSKAECLSCRMTITEIEDLALSSIKRCHRAFMVNVSEIKSIGKYDIILTNNEKIPISRREKQNILRYFVTT